MQVENHSKSKKKTREKIFIPYHPLLDRPMETSRLTILSLIWTSLDTPGSGATRPCQPHLW